MRVLSWIRCTISLTGLPSSTPPSGLRCRCSCDALEWFDALSTTVSSFTEAVKPLVSGCEKRKGKRCCHHSRWQQDRPRHGCICLHNIHSSCFKHRVVGWDQRTCYPCLASWNFRTGDWIWFPLRFHLQDWPSRPTASVHGRGGRKSQGRETCRKGWRWLTLEFCNSMLVFFSGAWSNGVWLDPCDAFV